MHRSNSTTPQGDGNVNLLEQVSVNERRSNSTTPQGDGNIPQLEQNRLDLHVQIPLPRKGTETKSVNQVGYSTVRVFKFHYPARGRKHWKQLKQTIYEPTAFKFHYPARGRKLQRHAGYWTRVPRVQIPLPRKGTETIECSSSPLILMLGSNSTTPQGDGNFDVPR